jgi:hypothetical protein
VQISSDFHFDRIGKIFSENAIDIRFGPTKFAGQNGVDFKQNRVTDCNLLMVEGVI